MRILNVIEFVTLDGVMQGFAGPDDDRDGEFRHGGWGAPYGDEVLGQKATDGMPRTTAYLFGRKTYERMAEHWPHEPADNPMAAHLNATPKYVATTTLTDLAWANAHVLDGDVADAVADLKARGDGAVSVLGSGVLVQALIDHDLVDQYQLFIHPLVLGTGKRLFRQTRQPIALRLVDCTPTTTGVLLLTYQPA